jgi:RNA polymerase sigma-70 factor, ECF subfamily
MTVVVGARLIVLAQAGDRRAFDQIFQILQAPLYRYIRSIVTDETLAEDVLQEVFLLIYRKIGLLAEPAVFVPWCYRIASREAMRRVRTERGRMETELTPDAGEQPHLPEVDLTQWIERAPPASRAVLALHYLEGFTLDEVAAIQDVHAGTVRSRLAYGLKVLREELKKQ